MTIAVDWDVKQNKQTNMLEIIACYPLTLSILEMTVFFLANSENPDEMD